MKNKKNILTFVVAMVLVAALSVGGTLAYLTATDDKVENEFTFGNMTVELEEPTPDPEKVPEGVTTEENKDDDGNVIGYKYVNILPGQTLPKNPQVSTVTTTPAWLFIEISGANNDVEPKEISEGWTAVTTGAGVPDDYKNGIYYRAVDSTTTGKMDVFTEVEVNPDSTGVKADGTPIDTSSIVIDVFEIQQGEIEFAAALAQAEAHFAA